MEFVSNKLKIVFIFFVKLLISHNCLAEETIASGASVLRDSAVRSVEPKVSPLKAAEAELAENIFDLVQQMDSGGLDVVEGRMAIKDLIANFRQIRVELLRLEGRSRNSVAKHTHAQLIDGELNAAIKLDESQEDQIRQLLSGASRDTLDNPLFSEYNSEGVHLDEILFGEYRIEDKILEQQASQRAFEGILYRMQLIQLWLLINSRRSYYGLDPIIEDVSLMRALSDTTFLE
tara:strand:- start:235 stop:933 length:699 start_codon:yes stop_codon:yes gene_type:complete